jgi:mannose-1-phosphate guanylyltransferase
MKAILLAAGLGTRLRPVTNDLPKCLVPIKKKPLLSYWLELLDHRVITDILINTHYLAQQVEVFVQQAAKHSRITLVHEDYLLGTAGTVLANKRFIDDEPFLLAHADNLTRFDVQAFIAAHHKRKPSVEMTMMTFDTDVPQSCGIVDTDENNIVQHFYEKTHEYHGTRANAAVYIMEPSVIDFLQSFNKEIIDMSTEVLPQYLGRMQTFHNDDYHRDIGTLDSLRLAEMEY